VLKVVQEVAEPNTTGGVGGIGGSLLDGIVRAGARQMLAAALQAEVAAYVDAHAGELDEHGHRSVVRNGYHQPREVTTAAGAVPVRTPRVNDKRIDPVTGERCRFSSAILPAWARKSPQVAEGLPLLYLHGLSSGDFTPVLEQFLGSGAGLSASTVVRLTAQWQDEAAAFNTRSLNDTDYVYVWVDGIHLKVRLAQDKVCLLVMIGVRADGQKELIALADGFRESTESWADLLRAAHGVACAPRSSQWGTVRSGSGRQSVTCSPETGEQRCGGIAWPMFLPRCRSRRIPRPRPRWPRSTNAEDKQHALAAVQAFEADFGAKWPKAVAKITDEVDTLLAFYDYPAEHWGAPTHHEPDRVDLRDRPLEDPGHQRTWLASYRRRDGVQADRVSSSPLACGQRAAPRRAGPRRSHLRERQTRRTPRRTRR